jgi:hypothetical protein
MEWSLVQKTDIDQKGQISPKVIQNYDSHGGGAGESDTLLVRPPPFPCFTRGITSLSTLETNLEGLAWNLWPTFFMRTILHASDPARAHSDLLILRPQALVLSWSPRKPLHICFGSCSAFAFLLWL